MRAFAAAKGYIDVSVSSIAPSSNTSLDTAKGTERNMMSGSVNFMVRNKACHNTGVLLPSDIAYFT